MRLYARRVASDVTKPVAPKCTKVSRSRITRSAYTCQLHVSVCVYAISRTCGKSGELIVAKGTNVRQLTPPGCSIRQRGLSRGASVTPRVKHIRDVNKTWSNKPEHDRRRLTTAATFDGGSFAEHNSPEKKVTFSRKL